VWVEVTGSLVRIHGQGMDRSLPFPNDAARFACRGRAGAIWWFGTRGIYLNNAGSYTTLALPPSFPKPDRQDRIQATEDGSGTLWLGAKKVGMFYRKSGVWHLLETASEFATLTPVTAFTDWMGRAWFGYEGGTIILL